MPSPCYPPRTDPLLIGASWYPEMWPEEEWAKDIGRMRELGFTMIRAFEFAWHRFEPRCGEYDTAWARRVLDLCHQAGIAVQLGTPTAAPPSWLTDTWPEVLKTHPDGRRASHGKRRHYSQHSRKYRELAEGIVRRLCQDLADHPAIHSWQIDNEMAGYDYGSETRGLFHDWLRSRFGGDIERLNRAWGLEFWSQAYTDFGQIPLCTAEVGSVEVPERHHPSLILAIAEFQNVGWQRFIADQASIIREFSDKPIASNMTGMVGGMNWFELNKAFDRVGASMYADRRYYYFNLPRFDRMRAEKQAPYWLLETAPNWSGGGRTFNIHFDAAGPRLFSWLNVFLGGELVLFWQWREHWAGQEMLHGTCVTATGRWRPNKQAWTELAGEFAAQGPWLQQHPPQRPELAIVMSNEASWAFSIDPTDSDMNYTDRFRNDIHLPIAERQLWRDVIHESADFAPYQVICLPLMPQVSADARARLADWVAAGGTLILGPLTGFRSREFTAFTEREFGGFEDLMGGTSLLRHTVQWIEDRVRVAFADGHQATCRTWSESYTPGPETTVLASYRGGYADGQAAVLDHRVGAGRVITLGTLIDQDSWGRLVAGACADAGITPVAEAGPRVIVVPRSAADGSLAGWAVANNSDQEQRVVLPDGGTERFSGAACDGTLTLAPWGVALVCV